MLGTVQRNDAWDFFHGLLLPRPDPMTKIGPKGFAWSMDGHHDLFS